MDLSRNGEYFFPEIKVSLCVLPKEGAHTRDETIVF